MSSQTVLDLSKYHAKHQHGDITVYLAWYGANTTEPCMVLVPSYVSPLYDRITPCVIRLSSAWLWDETIGKASHAAQNSAMFARHLGIEPSIGNLMRITAIVQDHLGDLLTMPPDQRETTVAADAIMIDREGRETTATVLTRV